MMNEFNPDGKDIRFIDSHYRDLFRIPDGGTIQVHYSDDSVVIKPCKFIDVVYVAPLSSYTDQTAMLEGLYTKFNVERPEDFRGHSLSVSDIVALKTDAVVSFHYVDSIGFQELQGFMKPENYLKNAEMAMEDDYGMLDGVINNGKAPATEERSSVLAQLKEQPVLDSPHKPPKARTEREME